jgi:hypothetical protein
MKFRRMDHGMAANKETRTITTTLWNNRDRNRKKRLPLLFLPQKRDTVQIGQASETLKRGERAGMTGVVRR